MSVFVLADGYGSDGTPLVRITKGVPRRVDHVVRNASGVIDIRSRPMFDSWEATVGIKWDADQFSIDDVANLLMRSGMQVGVGEGRNFSKNSSGMGWGEFELVGEQ